MYDSLISLDEDNKTTWMQITPTKVSNLELALLPMRLDFDVLRLLVFDMPW